MLKNINSYFNDFIIDRVIDIDNQAIRNNTKVQKLTKDYFHLFKKIIKSLPREDKNLLFRYEEKQNETEGLCLQMVYKQGFIDGFKAANISNELKNRDIMEL